MKTFARSIAIAASLLGVLALAPEAGRPPAHGGGGSRAAAHSRRRLEAAAIPAAAGTAPAALARRTAMGAAATGRTGVGRRHRPGNRLLGRVPVLRRLLPGLSVLRRLLRRAARVVDPTYSTVEPANGTRAGPARAAGRARTRSDLLPEERTKRGDQRIRPARMQPLGDDAGWRDERRQHLPARDLRLHGRPRLHRSIAPKRAPTGHRPGAAVRLDASEAP